MGFLKEAWGGVKKYFREADIALLAMALIASGFGMTLISSATLSMGSSRYLIVQGAAVFLGLIAFVILSLTDLQNFSDLWIWIYVANLLFLASTRFLGVGGDSTGNNSWLRFSIFGMSTGLQPAEIGRVAFILTLSKHMSLLDDRINSPAGLLQLMIHMILPVGVILWASDDMGVAASYLVIFLIMLFAGGLHFRYQLIAASSMAILGPLAWNFVLKPYQRDRFTIFMHPEADPLNTGYHTIQSKIAVGAGQLVGKGLYNGTQTQHSWLPAKHTDFIFSVAGEELGLIGCLAILILLTLIIVKCIHSYIKAGSYFYAMISMGVAAMLIFQTFVNIGMCIGLAPIIGITLPFFSYGGSSMLTMFAAVGLVASSKPRRVPARLKG